MRPSCLPLRLLLVAVLLLFPLSAMAQPFSASGAMSGPSVAPRLDSSPPLRLAEREALQPMARLEMASKVALDEIDTIERWNRAGKVPAKNGFSRALTSSVQVRLAPSLVDRTLAAGSAVAEHTGGLATRTASGDVVWGGEIRVEGATRVRVHLTDLALPASAKFWIYNDRGEEFGPFGLELSSPEGLWTPSIVGGVVRLEVQIPGSAGTGDLGFTVDKVLEIFDLDTTGRPQVGGVLAPRGTGMCIEDARCFNDSTFADFALIRAATARYTFVSGGSSFVCSGALINTNPTTFAPYFLTANHCISSATEAASVDARWDFFANSCNGTVPDPSTLPRTTGSSILSTNANTDHTLLRLNSIPASRGFAGWTASSSVIPNGTTLHRVSHPLGLPQSYSRSRVNTTAGTCSGVPRPNFIYHTPNLGGTFGGSSGAPLLLPTGQIVGQLLGGCGPNPDDGCDYRNADVDGAFNRYFSSVQPFLLPGMGGSDCVPSSTVMCLQNDRFKVEVNWANARGDSGPGEVVPFGSDDSGLFYFFNPNNWEMLIKILNGCPSNDNYWVFFAATTTVQFDVTVTDTDNGQVKVYSNPLGNRADAVTDTQAFATCP